MRTLKKNSRGVKTDFEYDGDKLIYQNNSDGRLDFLYDENGELYGFIKDSQDKYFYVRDCLKNILGIVDISGNLVVKYSYDAYGKCTISSDSASIGRINPFRFKGYYFDSETGFYYCNSRYYVPEWGRWLTADSIEYLDPTSVNGMNLYAYCNNDPINFCDFCGKNAKLALADPSSFSIFSQAYTGVAWLVNTLTRISTKVYTFWNSIPLLPPDDILGKAVGFSRNDKLIANVNTADSYKTAFEFTNKCMTVVSIGLFFLDVALTINSYAKDDNLSKDEKIAYAAMDIAVSGFVLGLSAIPYVGGILGIAFWLGYELGWKEPARRALNL